MGEGPHRGSGRLGFLKRKKADIGSYGRVEHFTSASPGRV